MREYALAAAHAYHAPEKINDAIPLEPEKVEAPLTPQGLVKMWAESGKKLDEPDGD